MAIPLDTLPPDQAAFEKFFNQPVKQVEFVIQTSQQGLFDLMLDAETGVVKAVTREQLKEHLLAYNDKSDVLSDAGFTVAMGSGSAKANEGDDNTDDLINGMLEDFEEETQESKAEAEKAKAEAEKAKAETEKAKAETAEIKKGNEAKRKLLIEEQKKTQGLDVNLSTQTRINENLKFLIDNLNNLEHKDEMLTRIEQLLKDIELISDHDKKESLKASVIDTKETILGK